MRFVLPTLAAVGAVAVWWGIQPAPLTFAVGTPGSTASADGVPGVPALAGSAGQTLMAPSHNTLPIRFSDGSRVTLARGTRVQVKALNTSGATLRIEKGSAEVDVRHRRQTNWKLQAGAFEVLVTGTRFSIDWEDRSEALTVVMAEGTVEVRGGHLFGDSPVVVTAGQKFQATGREPRWTLAAATPMDLNRPTTAGAISAAAVTVPLDSAEVPALGVPTEAPGPAVPSPRTGVGASGEKARSWQALARSGRYQEALQMVERAGFEKACGRLGAEDLVQLGDAARLARNPAKAERAYQVARRRFPSVDRPVFALGLVAFEQRRDFRTAAKWFDLYARKYPNGPLAREAVGREMESWQRAGDPARARHAARDYLDQAPTGPYAPLARQIAAP